MIFRYTENINKKKILKIRSQKIKLNKNLFYNFLNIYVYVISQNKIYFISPYNFSINLLFINASSISHFLILLRRFSIID